MASRRMRLGILLGGVVAVQLAAGPCLAQSDPSDPFEPMNRKFFAVEGVIDKVFGPVAMLYAKLPHNIRRCLGNFARNLGEPIVFANDVLQGHPKQAATTVGRFAINSTFGVAGLADVAKKSGIPHHDNSFGTTLGRWGVKSGPYLFVPLVGPTTVRDAVGSGVDVAFNPLTWSRFHGRAELGVSTTLISGLQKRIDSAQQLSTILETSTDPYATIRSYYLQNRQTEITGKPIDIGPLPDFDEPGAAPGAATPPPPSSTETEPAPASEPPSDMSAPAEPPPQSSAQPAPAAEPPPAEPPAPAPAQTPQ